MINNPTRHKVKEAEFHLQNAQEHYQEDEVFSYFLSAFLSAARSITFYMQKQYGKVSGFPEWYCIEQIKMVADAELKYLNEARVEDVHRKPVHTGATRASSCGIDAILLKEGEECPLSTETVVSQDTTESQNVTLRRYFADRDYIETIEFCSSQLSKLTTLVAECESRFL
ncbi:hypothetical protein [Geobacter sp.]|uniref:hypothetical protein n=1 Tax=Geobacter sp. TaxID=46610 RepID=UPI001AD075C5|nr:hypothetical protein [Geobacter sp.]CAG1770697.1 hypothetical protein BAC3_01263 [uncultured bacterium]